ncbi:MULTISPECIES: TIGR02221 family CRISPR-associated protein [unclassified Bradyrhizobium]|uniref:TIGR02221 family CRISPR-associated protein n=1 Tax=unclassified Bradyrhizobium TaxID=2631580 RepID=UPI0029165394|nr:MULTISPECIES: TIGR02221 family CRISPR-associated protein [unclassified Bradyrhizobium]
MTQSSKPRSIVVTRHAGAVDWLASQGISADLQVEELDPDIVQAGDTIIGTLPVHLAAEVNQRGGRFLHIAMDVPRERRGDALSKAEMMRYRARLVEYRVTEESAPARPASLGTAPGSVLITVLGGVGPKAAGYGRIVYDFGDGRAEASWFPAALLQHAAATQTRQPIRRVVVLGTPGSMWDVLVRQFGGEDTDLELELWDAARHNRTTDELLNRLTRHVRQTSGLPIDLKLIPYVLNLNEAFALVETVARSVLPGESAIIDVTHGLRHLAFGLMLGGFVLEDAGRGHIAGLTYGARELERDGAAPVLRLEGLTEIIRWIRALTSLRAAGDLRPIAGLLDDGGGNLTRGAASQAFGARTLDLHAAVDNARACLAIIRRRKDPIARLFRKALEAEISWCAGELSLSEQQAALAQRALTAGDYVGAALMGFEALLSALMENDPLLAGKDLQSSRTRQGAQERYSDHEGRIEPGRPRDERGRAYMRIKAIRNVLAHASLERDARMVARDLKSPAALHAAISECLQARSEK